MIELAAVHELVEKDVFPYERRRLDQTPVEGDRAGRRTGAPARSLIANRDPLDVDRMQASEAGERLWQFAAGPFEQPPLDDRADVVRTGRLADVDVAAPHVRSLGGCFHAQCALDAVDQKARPVRPGRIGRALRGTASLLLMDPITAGVEKGEGVALHAPSRQRDPDRSVSEHAENIATSPTMPDELHGGRRLDDDAGQGQAELHAGLR